MQRSNTDDQVLECELNALRFVLALNAPNESRDVKSHWIHRYIAAQPLDERQSLLLLCWCPCAISSMDQFGDGHD